MPPAKPEWAEEFGEPDWSLQDDFVEPELRHCSLEEVRELAAQLRDLQSASHTEEEASVLSNYSAFVTTAREISSLQADVSRASEALAGLAAVQQLLREPGHASAPAQPGSSLHLLLRPSEPSSTTAVHALTELLELLEVQLGALCALLPSLSCKGAQRFSGHAASLSATASLTPAPQRRASLRRHSQR